jgi:hypothetical protein
MGRLNYRMEAIRTAKSTFGACGLSVWLTVACPNRVANDCPIVKARPVKAARARQRTVVWSFLTLRADLFVSMDAG